MAKALIIAEKPSVAADIARALGGFTKQGDHFESEDYVLSSAVGHLVEIAAPEQYEVKRGKWSFAHLPVIPPHFDLQPIAKNEDRLRLLTRLIKRKDVDRLVNACDAGREGELIFRLIAQYAKTTKPVQRLWLQSMTPAAIREGFAQLREDAQMMPLADAARCRSEADWLVGINGTRAMTAFNSRDGGFYLTTVGRVQTPTLAIVVEREEKIRRFVAREYFEVRATFGAQAGEYDGRWFDPRFKKGDDAEHRAERLWERGTAEAIVAACRGKTGKVTDEAKPATQLSPLLFDLTSLQREANGRFGFSARNTLAIAQALYERHKVLTYPRTDSRYLPEDYIATVQRTMEVFRGGEVAGAGSSYAPHAKRVLDAGWVRPNKRIFDNTKVSDHFAIIPTLQVPRSLSEPELRIYDLVVKRFLAVFHPASEYLVTTRTTEVEQQLFRTEGRILVEPGWLAVYGRAADKPAAPGAEAAPGDEGKTLPKVEPDERVATRQIDAVALSTKPPPRYSEATLLSAMEGAGKTIEDDELREAMGAKGLGTPATRAAVIEGLIAENYLAREGRELSPTTKAFQLMTLLRGLGVTELTLPELTGEWEHKLAQMERGALARDAFMREIAAMTQQIVERAKNYQSDTIPGDYAVLSTPCPKCAGEVRENYKRFACVKCDFSISKTPGSRALDVAEAEALLRERTVGPLQGFRSKMGRPFAAILKLNAEHKLEFDFGQDAVGEDGEAEAVDLSERERLGACPKCGAGVFEHGMNYVCEKTVALPKACDFRSGKVILQQPIEPEQMRKLLADGRTDLLQDFVSNRNRRKFKAYLVRGADGKIGFEFEKRDPAKAKPGAKGKPPARAAAGAAQAGVDGAAVDAAGTITAVAKAAASKSGALKAPARKSAASKAGARKAPATKAAAAKAAAAKAASKPTDAPVASPRPTRSRKAA